MKKIVFYFSIILFLILYGCSDTSKKIPVVESDDVLVAKKLMETPSAISSSLKEIDRKVLIYNRAEILQILNIGKLNEKSISLSLCVSPNGKINYLELHDETTFEMTNEKKKELLRSIYKNLIFESSIRKEECGLYKIE